MNKIKKINILFVYHNYHCTDVDPPFLDWIYSQCNSNVKYRYKKTRPFLYNLSVTTYPFEKNGIKYDYHHKEMLFVFFKGNNLYL